MNAETKIPLSSDGDSRRIVKHADIDLYVTTEGWWWNRRRSYRAEHRPTGITSGQDWYATNKPEWALADCISKVLDHQDVRPGMGAIDRQLCEILKSGPEA